MPQACKLYEISIIPITNNLKIKNPYGAPGFEIGGIFAFPGFPNMLQAMLPNLQDRFGPQPESKMLEQQIRAQFVLSHQTHFELFKTTMKF